MGDLSEFSLTTRLFLRGYPWRRVDPVPWAPLQKPLAESRVALLSSAGLIAPGQDAFDESVRGGDPSFREIAGDAVVAGLRDTHRSETFDHTGLAEDPNLAFPLDRLRELQTEGRIGELNARHFSFMGSITAPGRLVKRTAPAVAADLVADGVDAALLVPI
jgi:D-proline reductase (dithiol) PrdB